MLLPPVPYIVKRSYVLQEVIKQALFLWSVVFRENLQPLLPCSDCDHHILAHTAHVEFFLHLGLIRAQILAHNDIISSQLRQILGPLLELLLQLLQLLAALNYLLLGPLVDLFRVHEGRVQLKAVQDAGSVLRPFRMLFGDRWAIGSLDSGKSDAQRALAALVLV